MLVEMRPFPMLGVGAKVIVAQSSIPTIAEARSQLDEIARGASGEDVGLMAAMLQKASDATLHCLLYVCNETLQPDPQTRRSEAIKD